ncbi:TetR/AcrR family transcriptional regulator [Nonomuraea jiangxiensis]|uniref:DNA-binding transcriptional regulator, AcrR family n=1 Tax=Nonomuraea jiangxiensis TaxID=633440 RepID=A0A1G8WCN2_9ACTN|nr:TetR/AcrR family transcriptional regulator [Nonomuraea jiangxiensis]SDJ75992.1 DNA-binding transcriptional regulator, AcrR family [Nonomuraea jiangxiensis]
MEEGLRERKKRETRQRIADIAMGLFMVKGFDNVTVAEVARTADVSVNTVFNYFSTKEDLFADRQDVAVDHPVQVVRGRAPGESVAAVFRRDFLDALETRHWRYGFNVGADVFAKLVNDSPTLVARMREIHELRERSLARALADEAEADDLTPLLVASQVLNTTRLLADFALRRTLAGEPWESIAPDLRAQAERAFDLLESGIGGYGTRPPLTPAGSAPPLAVAGGEQPGAEPEDRERGGED